MQPHKEIFRLNKCAYKFDSFDQAMALNVTKENFRPFFLQFLFCSNTSVHTIYFDFIVTVEDISIVQLFKRLLTNKNTIFILYRDK